MPQYIPHRQTADDDDATTAASLSHKHWYGTTVG